jgi:hypothetical protein
VHLGPLLDLILAPPKPPTKPANSCLIPQALISENILGESAPLRWEDNPEAIGYKIQGRVADYSPWKTFTTTNDTTLLKNTIALNEEPPIIIGVYPHPFKNRLGVQFHVQSNTNIEFEILDLTGNLILKDKLGQYLPGLYFEEFPDAQYLNSGFYILRINTGKGRSLDRKIIKE